MENILDKQVLNERKQKQKIIISPLSIGKRILLFFADFFFLFMVAFTLYNAAFCPLTKLVFSYNKKVNDNIISYNSKLDILYGNKILFYENSNDKYNFDNSLSFTYKKYLSYYVLVEENSNLKNEEFKFGNYVENNVLQTYFINIKNDESRYEKVINDIYSHDNEYFILNNNQLSLKKEYREQLRSFYTDEDTISTLAKKEYKDIQEKVFLNLYSSILEDILINDLTFKDASGDKLTYIDLNNKNIDFDNYESNLYGYSSLICFLLCWLIYYIVIPLCNSRGRTLAMMMMKLERISSMKFTTLKKWERIFYAIYNLATNIFMVIFLPMILAGVNYVFSINILFVSSFVSLLFILISLIFMFFSNYHRPISDFCSKSVVISSDNLDEIYKAKGYKDFNEY